MLLKKGIPVKYIFRKIRFEITLFTLYAIAVYVLKETFHLWTVSMPLTIPAILGTAISLLLAFRTNQSYDRWWEARRVWGAIVNDSRTFTRQLTGLTNTDKLKTIDEKNIIKRMAYRQIAWNYALGYSLRGLNAIDHLSEFIAPEEISRIKNHDNIPNGILHLQMKDLQYLLKIEAINAFQQVEISQSLTRLCDSMGASERIKNTIFPSTYSLYIHFFIYFFIIILPLGLVDLFGIIEVPIVVSMASAFFLIEKTAIHMQDPFENKPTDISVIAISRIIERNIRQMLDEEEVPRKIDPEKYFLM